MIKWKNQIGRGMTRGEMDKMPEYASEKETEQPGTPVILREDREIIVCVKGVGLSSETALPALLRTETGAAQVLCVHRLDTAVGGVMVYAKTAKAAAALSGEIAARRMEKGYFAVCRGAPAAPEGELRDYLFKDSRSNKVFVVNSPRKGVKEAALQYRVLAEAEGCSLLQIRLATGRSHQIRVQFASRKLPLLGDGKYGSREKGKIALWSGMLRFAHPETGEAVCVCCPPPAEAPWDRFAAVLSRAEEELWS